LSRDQDHYPAMASMGDLIMWPKIPDGSSNKLHCCCYVPTTLTINGSFT